MSPYDVIFILPYPYSDHPSFPEGILRKSLEREGFRVGIIETPFWQKSEPFSALGRPKLFFAIISGPLDSVVLNYTSLRKRRREDLYQPSGKAFFEGYPPSVSYKIRPDRTVVVFANRLRECFKEVPIVIGGLEGSLRRFAHYDFQQDRLRRSILFDARADILVTGMGEKQLLQIARFFRSGGELGEIKLCGIARTAKEIPEGGGFVALPSFEEILEDRTKLLEAYQKMEKALLERKGIYQRDGDHYVVEHPPETYRPSDLDDICNENYTRMHLKGDFCSPALRMNLFSVTSHRGCSGGCSFCAIGIHQGNRTVSRSVESIVREIHDLIRHPAWKGYISDLGGPTADMYGSDCGVERCRRPSCLYPKRCGRFSSGPPYLSLLRECRRVKGVRKIFLGSGIRYDSLLSNPELLEEIMVHHCGRILRIAPEHTEMGVLNLMRKPAFEVLEAFVQMFRTINGGLKRKIDLAPYVMVGHPGETWGDVMEMRKKLTAIGLRTTDVQIFTPSPGTLSTAMYYAGFSPSLKEIPVEKRVRELMRRKDLLTRG